MRASFAALAVFFFSTAAFADGTITVKNDNCKIAFKDHVKVNIWDNTTLKAWDNTCTVRQISLKPGETGTYAVVAHVSGTNTDYDEPFSHDCTYKHEAVGTVGGKRDLPGHQQTSVTCRKDWFGVCQCTKG